MTPRNKVQLGELFPALGLSEDAEAHRSLEIHRIALVEKAREGDLVFVSDGQLLKQLKEASPTAAVIGQLFRRKFFIRFKKSR